MAKLKKIYRGMQNGAETIDKNFAELDGSSVRNTGAESIAGKKTFTDDMVVKNIEVTGNYKKSTDTEMINLPLSGVATAKVSYMKKNGIVYVTGAGNWGNWGTGNTNIKKGTLPLGFRPPVDWNAGMSGQGAKNFMSATITTSGDLNVNCAETGNDKYGGFSMSYPAEN